MQVLFRPQAERDLEEIGNFIAADNPARAVTFVRELRERCARIAAAPMAHTARPELGDNIRSCPYGRYVIFFHSTNGIVSIVRVLHSARDLSRVFGETS
jgi:toxin ParE1/3/4